MMANGWQMVPFGEVLKEVSRPETLNRDKTYRILGMRWYAQGLFIREDKPGHEIQANELFRVEKDDFVYNRLFAWKGSFGIVDDTTAGGYVSGEFPCFHVIIEKADPKFIQLYLSQEPIWNEIARISSGQTNISRLRLKVPTFLAMEIPLPPLTEQRRIVERIEALAGRLAKAQSLRREASEEAKALLESAVGKVFSKINGMNTHPLKTLATKIGSGSTPKGGRETYVSEGIPFIRSMNVRMRYFQYDDIAYIDEAIHESMSGTKVKPSDVLLNITGASIGRVACAPENIGEANVNQHVAIIRPIKTLDHRFLMYWLSQPEIQKYINNEQKGATRQGFTKYQIGNLNVPVPPLEEQRRLVAYLDGLQAQVSQLRLHQAETQEELDALMPSVLDRAFEGEL